MQIGNTVLCWDNTTVHTDVTIETFTNLAIHKKELFGRFHEMFQQFQV